MIHLPVPVQHRFSGKLHDPLRSSKTFRVSIRYCWILDIAVKLRHAFTSLAGASLSKGPSGYAGCFRIKAHRGAVTSFSAAYGGDASEQVYLGYR